MANANPFATLLGPQNTSAQLAILQPATDSNAPIRLTLTQAVLKDTSYEVISYDRAEDDDADADADADADDADPVPVSVESEEHAVPRALESALRTFRRKEKPRTLWADLLIGRTDAERSLQAAAQRQILSGASKTLCWLGPGPSDDAQSSSSSSSPSTTSNAIVFETIAEMGRRWGAACAAAGIEPDTSLAQMTPQQMSRLRAHLGDCAFDDLRSFDFAHWREVYGVFGAAYWGEPRAIPEIVLARSAVVARGRGHVRWHAYIGASRALPFLQAKFFGRTPLLPRVMRGFEAANSIEIAERRRRLGESVELFPMIQTARDCAVNGMMDRVGSGGGSGGKKDGEGDNDKDKDNKKRRRRRRKGRDPRENVFAMIPITTPSARVHMHGAGPQPLPVVDYTKSTAQVFAEAARYTVLERQDLLLWYGEQPPCARRRRRKGLPTWVPDFSTRRAKDGLLNPNNGMRGWWDALPDGPLKRKPIAVSANNRTLHVHARPLDRIVHVSPIFDGGNHRRLCFTEFRELTSSPSFSPPLDTERFWRTLVLNASGEHGAMLHENVSPAADAPNGGPGFNSLIAEETILDALGCASVAELQTPENTARLQASPDLMRFVPMCGRGEPYLEVLLNHAAGRRFFRTAGGRFGMTAVEDMACVNGNFGVDDGGGGYSDDEEVEVEGVAGNAAGQENTPPTVSTSTDDSAQQTSSSPSSTSTSPPPPPPPPPPPQAPNMGHLMADPLARAMMESFQEYLRERDPAAAKLTANMMRGELPEGVGGEQQQARPTGGVQEGDIVVACVGGFFPYVLRPRVRDGGDGTSATAAAAAADDSTYEFIGECYLHGAMNGEDFQVVAGSRGERAFRPDLSQLVPIAIV